MQRRPITKQQERKRKQRVAQQRRSLGFKISLVMVVSIALVILLVRLPFFRTRSIVVEGNQLVKTEDVTAYLQNQFAGNHGIFIPNNHIFFMRRSAIEEKLLEAFPRMQRVRIDRGALHTVRVRVVERPHAFLWCANQQLSECYFADDTGLLFAKAPFFSGRVFLTFTGGSVDTSRPIDSYILSDREEFARLVRMMNTFDDAGFSVASVAIGLEREYTIGTPQINGQRTPYASIIATTRMEPALTVTNIGLAMDTEKFKQLFAERPETLSYIDARLPEKVFYKFGLSTVAPPATTEVTE